MHGAGVDLFGGYHLEALGLVPEVEVGFHAFASDRRIHGFDVETVWTMTPMLAGARYRLALTDSPLRAHAAAHFGAVYTYWERELLGVRGSGSATHFALNAGLGADWILTDTLGVGATVWYWLIVASNDQVEESGNAHLLSAAAHVTLAL